MLSCLPTLDVMCCLFSFSIVHPMLPFVVSQKSPTIPLNPPLPFLLQEEIGASNLGTCLTQNYGWTSTCGAHAAPPSNIVPGDVLVVCIHLECLILKRKCFFSVRACMLAMTCFPSDQIVFILPLFLSFFCFKNKCITSLATILFCFKGPRQQLHGLRSPRHPRLRSGLRRHHGRCAHHLPQH